MHTKSVNQTSSRFWLISLLVLCHLFAFSSSQARGLRDIKINADPVSFAIGGQKKFGALEWRGSLVLSSDANGFGGFSGLTIDPDGQSILAVTDAGKWLRAKVRYRGNKIIGLEKGYMGVLKAKNGSTLRRKRTQDAEAISLARGTVQNGTAYIGFERIHRIGRFQIRDGKLSAPKYISLPPAQRRATRNKGLEAVAYIKYGRSKGGIVAINERHLDRRGHSRGWLIRGKKFIPFYLTRKDGYDITDAVSLPDGNIAVLERRFRKPKGFMGYLSPNYLKMRIRYIKTKNIRRGAVLKGKILLKANRSFRIDNMEGLAAHQNARGETILTLISDDNFNPIQETLLHQFALIK